MLLLILSSSFVRISGSNRRKTSANNAGSLSSLASDTGTTARTLVFHDEDTSTGDCEDLVITAAGNAVYSNWRQGVEKQYSLSNSEQTLLANWIQYFQPINYDLNDKAGSGNEAIQLNLNGKGGHQADSSATNQLQDFAKSLTARISSQSGN